MPDIENQIKRIMPHSDEAEQSVLGSMLMDRDAIVAAGELLTGEDFYVRANGILFETMTELEETGSPVDLVTLQNRLREKNVPPEVSGFENIQALLSAVPYSTNVRSYAKIVREKAVLRRLIRATEEVAGECYSDNDELENILNDAEKKIFDLVQNRSTDELVPIRKVVENAIDKIEAASRNHGYVTGIATGFYDLDRSTAGFQNSELILIAARPSMGKTALELNIAQHMVLKEGKTALIFSLEMSNEQLVNRIFSLQSSVDATKIRTGKLSFDDWNRLTEAATEIGRSRLLIDDTPSISVAQLRSKCRKVKMTQGLDIIFIDYLQLMSGGAGKHEDSRQQEISNISRALKALARELNIPVVAFSQLNRSVEQRPDHRPMLSDLRESGAIEQDADVVMFIYREDYYKKDTDRKGISEIIIAKQRNGPIGTVELAWLPEYTKFANLERNVHGGEG